MFKYPYTDSRSVLNLVIKEVLPFSIIDKTRPYPAIVIVNGGSQRFDIIKGPFTVDDGYIVSPFPGDFVYATVPYKVAKKIFKILNKAPASGDDAPPPSAIDDSTTLTPGFVTKDDYGYGGDDWAHSPIPAFPTPAFVSSPLPAGLGDNDLIDVVWLAFFNKGILSILKNLDPANNYTSQPYRVGVNTITMWPIYVKANWSKC
ncbi:hypothetical protein BGZ65_011807 [Modicella reniformis]|uniref:Putative 5'-nucleotidase C-terminal domain-containing protein n=1 Tax=Modicella reniformis TaxID=1440133 RepID=A0A9P6IQU4_9FUNG|nr:hypothetical protein BGZ65_011807 [Modicella reniformis]